LADQKEHLQDGLLMIGGRLAKALSGLATVVVGATAVAYAVGWLYLRGYYQALGARFMLDLLPITAIAQVAFPLVLALAGLSLSALQYLTLEKPITFAARSVLFWSVSFIISLVAHWFFPATWLKIACFMLGAISIGNWIIASVFAYLADPGQRSKYHPAIAIALIIALIVVPDSLGSFMAQDHMTAYWRSLPCVALVRDGSEDSSWRLVDVRGGLHLIARMRPDGRVVSYRVVTAETIAWMCPATKR